MTDPGLSNRLRQHSRRAGLMVGVTMALTIAICVGGFAFVYAGLAPILSDFVPLPTRAATRIVEVSDRDATRPSRQPTPQPTTERLEEPTASIEVEPTPTSERFAPTHEISAGTSVNLRPDPSTNNTALRSLPPRTPLQYLGEDAPTANPASDGDRWMKFRIEDGAEGWVREIDVGPYRP